MAAATLVHELLSPQDLLGVLQDTFSNNREQRKAAEDALTRITASAGCIVMLLQFVVASGISRDIRQAASIAIKNAIRGRWDPRPDGAPPFSNQEKELARGNILEALARETDKSVRGILAECVKEISQVDYPDHWPDMLPTLEQQMRTGEPLRVLNALLALRKVVKVYEYKPKEKREPLMRIIATTFPLLQTMFATLLPNDSPEAAEVLRLVLKIFWSATQFSMPVLADPNALNFHAWFDLLAAILAKPVAPLPGDNLEERNAWPWWKVKKWACQIASRFFSRYGNPHYADTDGAGFAETFSARVAPKLLQQVMALLALRPAGQACTDKVVHSCLMFVNSSIELASTYRLLKPHLDFLLLQVMFPLLCFSQEDLQLFESDPREFVHKHNDPMEDFLDPKMPAINLLVDLAKFRPKDILPKLLTFLVGVLNTFVGPPAEGVVRDYRQKDGALVAFGSLEKVLKKKKEYRTSLETLLMQHVLPEFDSPVAFMRSRACWMMQHYVDIKFSRREHLLMCLRGTLRALQDPCLPVQIEAASALKFMIELDGTEETLLPVLPQILNEYFRIMREIGSDVVVVALEVIIDRFRDHIGPHAVTLTQKLSEYFTAYAKEGYDDDDAAMAAGQCIEAVATVLYSVHTVPSLYPEMERHILPMLRLVLGNEGEFIEYLENALDVVTYLTYYGPGISPDLWTLFPMIYDAFSNWAYDYITNMATPIDNFVSRGSDGLLTGRSPAGMPYVEMVLRMAQKVLEDRRQTEPEQRTAAQMLMCVMHSCKGRVDAYLPAVLGIVLGRLQGVALPPLKVSLLETVASALHYSPALTFEWMKSAGATQLLLSELFLALQENHFKTRLGKKLVALGLSSFFALAPSAMPPEVAANLGLVVSGVVGVVAAIREAEEEEEEEEEDEEADGEADGGGGAGRVGGGTDNFDDGDDDDDADAGAGAFAGAGAAGDGGAAGGDGMNGRRKGGCRGDGMAGGGGGSGSSSGGKAGQDDDADDNGFDENEDVSNDDEKAYLKSLRNPVVPDDGEDYRDDEEDDYASAIDDIDALQFFYTSFRDAYAQEPQFYQQLQASLPERVQQQLRELLATAEAAVQEATAASASASAAAAAAAACGGGGGGAGTGGLRSPGAG